MKTTTSIRHAGKGAVLCAGVFLLAAAACAPLTPPPAEPGSTLPPTAAVEESSTSDPQSTPEKVEEEPTMPAELPETADVAAAKADLAQRLEIDEADIAVIRVEEVDWPDGSLGCPMPDMMYTQAIVNGVFIELEVDGQSYNYHGGGGRPPILCTSKDEVLPEDLPDDMRGNPDS